MANKAAISKYMKMMKYQTHVHVDKEGKRTRGDARKKLTDVLKSQTASVEDKWDAMLKLQKRPVKESQTRLNSRCKRCGRPHAVDTRRTGLCRMCLRQFFCNGWLPGYMLSSW